MSERRLWQVVVGLFVLGVALRWAYGLTQLSRGFLFISEGDYNLYQIGAEHILAHGDFTNSLFLVRPPLFPLLIALLRDNQMALILVNGVLGAALSPLVILLARQLKLSVGVALLAGLLLAVDPITVRYTVFLGSEALSFVPALGMLNAMIALLESKNARRAMVWGGVAAVLLLLSAFARPSIYLIWTGMSVWLLIERPHYWAAVAAFVVVSAGGVFAWQQHNAQAFGHNAFSTVGPYTMVYYRAVPVLRQGEGISVEDAYLEINQRLAVALGEDPAEAASTVEHRYMAATPEVAQAFNDVSIEIFLMYPGWYVLTLGLGTLRYFNLIPLWPVNVVVLWNWVVLIAAGYGLYRVVWDRRWRLAWMAVLFGGYFTAGTLLVKSAGMTGRDRTVIFPLMALLAAYALTTVWRILRRRGAA